MNIDLKTVDRVAALAKLDFAKDEKVRIQQDLNKIVAYFDKLNEVDTEGVEPLVFMTEEINAFRKDIPFQEISKEDALKMPRKKIPIIIKCPNF